MSVVPVSVRRMRILHTSDWHLGRTLHGVDLLDAQAAYLDHLVEVVQAEGVGAVVVSGDFYDRAIPPVEAVQLLGDALQRLSEHATVVVTPGNHDSAIRLGFGAGLLRSSVHVRARVADVGRPVELADDDGTVLVYALPYLDPDAVRRELADDGGCGDHGRAPDAVPEDLFAAAARDEAAVRVLPRSHEAVMAAAMRRVRADLGPRPAARSVVMAHAFVVGGAASESERDIRVGGVDAVPAGVFDGVDYVALGHLHGPQRLAAGPRPSGADGAGPVLQYSGSPLAYSFSERHHRKASVLVDLDARGGAPVTEYVPAPVPRRLAEVTGTLEELLAAVGEPHLRDWVRVVVTDPVRPSELYARVRSRFPHALVVEHRPDRPALAGAPSAVTAGSDPLEVAAEFVAHITGARPTPAEADVLRRAYEHVLAAERSA